MEKNYSFVVKENYPKKEIENIIENCSSIEQIQKFVQENLNKSKMLLNDIENISEIEKYYKEMGYSYCSNFIESENVYDISFRNIDYYEHSSLIIDDYEQNYKYPIILKHISKKVFFIDFLDNIQDLIINIVSFLKRKITFKKHLELLNNIEQFLEHFSENIFYNYSYNFKDFEQFPKFFKMDLNNFENNPKNIFKVLKHSFLKILNCIYKIIEQNVL